jgi:hypothetical protein
MIAFIYTLFFALNWAVITASFSHYLNPGVNPGWALVLLVITLLFLFGKNVKTS